MNARAVVTNDLIAGTAATKPPEINQIGARARSYRTITEARVTRC